MDEARPPTSGIAQRRDDRSAARPADRAQGSAADQRASARPSARRSTSDFVPAEDSLLVERLRRAGAIIVGKTNTPEFGAGSQTFNPVFGATLNPYDHDEDLRRQQRRRGGRARCGMLPIADGSDMGGSLRNPASFCNVVGLRPSPGRVPSWPTPTAGRR